MWLMGSCLQWLPRSGRPALRGALAADRDVRALCGRRRRGRARETFRSHPQAEIIESLPGMGPILGAEFVVAAGAQPVTRAA